MANGFFNIKKPANEPVLGYLPGSPEKAELKAKIQEMKSQELDIPALIGGEEVRTGDLGECRIPHEHAHLLGKYHNAGTEEINTAIDAAMEARKTWATMAWQDRLAIFMKAGELLAGPYRAAANASTMLAQSKNAFQAEIDSACELIDFLRFNSYFATQLYSEQPESAAGIWNRLEFRPLEGFVLAVTPFNFSSIAGNLPTAPAMMGNTVLWKPARSAIYSAWIFMECLREAGLPDGVINFLPCRGSVIGDVVLASEHLAGIHFTGSTGVFNGMWETVGKNMSSYRGYPRLVGETGGKDFVFAHKSADVDALVTALARGAFEYQGQKCSAASRAYIPDNLWPEVKDKLLGMIGAFTMGSPEDFTNFINAVIDRPAFDSISEYIEFARQAPDAEILIGGTCDDSVGYFIEPTVILAEKPDFKTMVEEIFGPVLTIYVYPADEFDQTLDLCDNTSPYGLTGAIFAQDRAAIGKATEVLVHAAGNFYINDKPTGAVVGQQPFGGGRASGTNDKAGSMLNLQRWVSPRTIKENFVPPTDFRYGFMAES